MIPTDTPIGQKLVAEYYSNELKPNVADEQQSVQDIDKESETINDVTQEEIIKTLSNIKDRDQVNWIVLKNTLHSASKATQMLRFLQQGHFVQGTVDEGYVPNVSKIEQYLDENSSEVLEQKDHVANELEPNATKPVGQRTENSYTKTKESGILKAGKIFFGIFIAGLLLRACFGHKPTVAKKYPALTTLQDWEIKPSNTTLALIIK